MMLAGFLILLVLTGGKASNHSELLQDQQKFNHSSDESGKASNHSELLHDQQKFNQSSDESGKASNHSELLHDQQKFNQSSDESGSTSSHSELTETPNLLDDQQMSNHSSDEDVESSKRKCSYQDLLEYLNLTKKNYLYTLTRPVKDHRDSTNVYLKMSIYAILDMREIDQKFISYIWIYVSWFNDHIFWDPEEFCGIDQIVVPTELLWKPDLIIEEMTEKDKAAPSPYLTITSWGKYLRFSNIELRNDQVVISTCRMQVYSFPFDTQRCNLSFKSAVYSDKEIKLHAYLNASKITEWSRDLMRTQYEWLFINMSGSEETNNRFLYNQSMIVYTITMKRRSVLYIVNFILPILFFLFLDLASFMISDGGGEKLSFKITVLLAVTVMQLILNEILPSSSDKVPLIAVYCVGIFGLMMLSLLETVFVVYLMGKDLKEDKAEKDQSLSVDCEDKRGKISFRNCFRDEKKWTPCVCVCDVSADETPSELLSVAKEGSSSKLTEESPALEKISEELRQMEKTLSMVFNSREGEGKPGYWTRVAQTFSKVFFICYVVVTALFLIIIFSVWSDAANNSYD